MNPTLIRTAPDPLTRSGIGRRAENQDRALGLTRGHDSLIAVADGMGGGVYGGEAAQIAVDHLRALFNHGDDLETAFALIQDRIVQFEEGEDADFATTLTAAVVLRERGIIVSYHTGDCRLLLVTQRQARPLTFDHEEDGALTRALSNRADFPFAPDVASHPFPARGPAILLAVSDGFWRCVSRAELHRGVKSALRGWQSLEEAIDRLQALAAQRAGDNFTISAVWVRPPVSSAVVPSRWFAAIASTLPLTLAALWAALNPTPRAVVVAHGPSVVQEAGDDQVDPSIDGASDLAVLRNGVRDSPALARQPTMRTRSVRPNLQRQALHRVAPAGHPPQRESEIPRINTPRRTPVTSDRVQGRWKPDQSSSRVDSPSVTQPESNRQTDNTPPGWVPYHNDLDRTEGWGRELRKRGIP